jgi:hypothetical protein
VHRSIKKSGKHPGRQELPSNLPRRERVLACTPDPSWIWSRRSILFWSRNERNGLAGRVRNLEWFRHQCRHGSLRSVWRVTASSSIR